MEESKKVTILRRLFDEGHINLEEMIIILKDEDYKIAINIELTDIEKFPHLFILK